MSRGTTFAADLAAIELVAGGVVKADRAFQLHRDGSVTIVPVRPDRPAPALATELLESIQPVLRAAYMAVCARPGHPPHLLYGHAPCGAWRLQTKARSTSKCECGDATPRHHIPIPWAPIHNLNHHGRPRRPSYRKAT